MNQTPTAEQFLSLSKAASRYQYIFTELIEEVFEGVEQGKVTDAEIADLTKLSVKAREMAVKAAVDADGLCALNWLECQAHFTVAKDAAKFKDDGLDGAALFERMIQEWAASPSLYCRPYIFAEPGYLDFVSGIGEAAHRYMTGQSVKEVRSSSVTVKKIKTRLSEIEKLLASDTLPLGVSAHISEALQIPRAIRILESEGPLMKPLSRRNDAGLPARLMAYDLLWHYQMKFGDPQLRAVSQLLGLFFDNKYQIDVDPLRRFAKELGLQAERRARIYLEQGRVEEERLAARSPVRTQHEALARLASDSLRAVYEREASMKP